MTERTTMRRRLLQTIIAIVTVVGVLGGGVAADAIVRAEMASIARHEIAHALSGPFGTVDPDDVQVEVRGMSAIMQLLLGSVENLQVTVPDIAVGESRADFHAEMVDVPTNQVQPVGRIYSYLEFDEQALLALAQQFVATPVESVSLEPPYVRVTTSVPLPDGTIARVTIDIDPNVRNGEIVLVPASFVVDGERLTPEQLQQRTGLDPSMFLDVGGFCIEPSIPAAMTVDDFRVSNGSVVIVLGAQQLTVLELGGPHDLC